MPRFANILVEGMKKKGHSTEVWTAAPMFYNPKAPTALRKWLGYIDQFIVFPKEVKKRLQKVPNDSLFVFTDQALGPWIPLVSDKLHIIHCHDFLAQRSALGEIPQNPTGWSGQQYQAYIRNGYRQGKNFISVSQKTRDDLHRFLGFTPSISEVVYNGMNKRWGALHPKQALQIIQEATGIPLPVGYILHVGGNQWYKNRSGLIELYTAWRKSNSHKLPLLLIGAQPARELVATREHSAYRSDIHFLTGKDDEFVKQAYTGASLFLYPSLAEGFGWPIAEAMAAGCPVITTGEAPMNEVGRDAAFYIDRMPLDKKAKQQWLEKSVIVIDSVAKLSADERNIVVQKGIENVERFNTDKSIQETEDIYQKIAGMNN